MALTDRGGTVKCGETTPPAWGECGGGDRSRAADRVTRASRRDTTGLETTPAVHVDEGVIGLLIRRGLDAGRDQPATHVACAGAAGPTPALPPPGWEPRPRSAPSGKRPRPPPAP